jgi:hypothetical protein
LQNIEGTLRTAWGKEARRVVWPLTVRVGTV